MPQMIVNSYTESNTIISCLSYMNQDRTTRRRKRRQGGGGRGEGEGGLGGTIGEIF